MSSDFDDKRKEVSKDSAAVSLSHFADRLGGLRLVKTTCAYYNICKKTPVLGKGLQLVESGSCVASKPLVYAATPLIKVLPDQVVQVADAAVECAVKLDNTVCSISQSTSKILQKARYAKKHCLNQTLQKFFQSLPGRLSLRGLDLLISLAEQVLDMMEPEVLAERGERRAENHTQPGKAQLNPSKQNQVKERTFYSRILGGLISTPIQILLYCLRFVKSKLTQFGFKRDKPTSITSPSLKNTAVLNRRKLSPKKKLAGRSYLRRFLTHALGLLGVRQMTKLNQKYHRIRYNLEPMTGSPKERASVTTETEHHDHNPKRTHSDVSNESLSDTDIYDLVQDMEDYESEEDPDFEPEDHASDDSLEYLEGDTESFLDLTDDDIEPPTSLKRIPIKPKDKRGEEIKTTEPSAVKPKETAEKGGTKPDKKSTPGKTKTTYTILKPKIDENAGEKKQENPLKLKIGISSKENLNKPQGDQDKKAGKNVVKMEGKSTVSLKSGIMMNGQGDKENEKPRTPEKNMAPLQPQNTSSPVLQPGWKKIVPSN